MKRFSDIDPATLKMWKKVSTKNKLQWLADALEFAMKSRKKRKK